MTRTVLRMATRWDRGIGPRLFALLAVVGLLAPTAARFASSDGAAWLPDHGHIFLSNEAAARPHAHPWDSTNSAANPAHLGALGEGAPIAHDGVLFTTADIGSASSLTMLALPAFGLLVAIAWLSDAIEVPRVLPGGWLLTPLVPPPQG